MTAPVPCAAPSVVTAGDSWSWRFDDTRYPSDIWTPSYAIVGIGMLTWNPEWVVDGLVTVPPDASSGLPAGDYRFTLLLTSATDRKSFALPTLLVNPDPAQASAGEKTWRQQEICDLKVAISAMTQNSGITYYQIGRRIYQRSGLDLMLKALRELEAEESRAQRPRFGQTIRHRFVPVGP